MEHTLLAGVVGVALFVATFLIDGATRPGYNVRRHAVSALALGSRGWLQTSNFLVCGTLVTIAAIGVWDATRSLLLSAAIAVFGLALIASGVFPMDAMRAYPPGTPDTTPEAVSMRHTVHDWAGAAVFISLPAAAVVAAFALDDTPWRIYSAVTAAALVVLAGAFGSAWERDSPRAGEIQRVMIIAGWLWLGLLFWHLLAA